MLKFLVGYSGPRPILEYTVHYTSIIDYVLIKQALSHTTPFSNLLVVLYHESSYFCQILDLPVYLGLCLNRLGLLDLFIRQAPLYVHCKCLKMNRGMFLKFYFRQDQWLDKYMDDSFTCRPILLTITKEKVGLQKNFGRLFEFKGVLQHFHVWLKLISSRPILSIQLAGQSSRKATPPSQTQAQCIT